MARIVDFLNALADDPELEARFDATPRDVMLEFGLDAGQGLLILGGTPQELREAVQDEVGQDITVIMIKMRP